MDESACLVRSFSNPVYVSREVKEGDLIHAPLRALTESISFGRFVSDSLAWEKWSAFSQNRYLEEIEKCSKPGSVAQMKDFFEAHYKKRATMRAAALLEQANIVTNDASEMGTINSAAVEPSLDMDLANLDSSSAANQHEKDVPDAEIANTAYLDADNLNVVRENDVTDLEQGPAMMEEDVNMEECQQVDNSNAFENGDIHDKIMATPMVPPEKHDDPKNSTSSSKRGRTNSSSKSSLPGRASKSKSRESSTPLQTPSRASVDGGSKHASQVPQSQDKRTISVNKSVSAAGDSRWLPFFNSSKSLNTSGMSSRSSNASGTSRRSSNASGTITIPCPFIFRCEERAEKRKEFFKKLEEKMKSKEAEKSNTQIKPKEKVMHDMNKSRQSTDVKARPNEDPCHGSQIPYNNVKKITSSRSQSPKQGRNPSHGTVQNANSRPSRRPSINIESTKNGLTKNNRISGTSLIKKRHENASPNIQVSVGLVPGDDFLSSFCNKSYRN